MSENTPTPSNRANRIRNWVTALLALLILLVKTLDMS